MSSKGTSARNALRISRFEPVSGVVQREVYCDLIWAGCTQEEATEMAERMAQAIAIAFAKGPRVQGTELSVELDPTDTPFLKLGERRQR